MDSAMARDDLREVIWTTWFGVGTIAWLNSSIVYQPSFD